MTNWIEIGALDDIPVHNVRLRLVDPQALAVQSRRQPQVLYDVLTEGLFSAPAYKVYGKIIVEEGYDRAGSTIALNLKDANLIIAAGDIARVPLPSGNTFRDRLLSAIAHGDAAKDVAALALEQARASGLA